MQNAHTIEIQEAESSDIFRQLVISVWVTVAVYTAFYAVLGAAFTAIVCGLGAFVLSPLTLFLEKRTHPRVSRLLFLISCNLYIYGSSLGLGHDVRAEFYSVPALMLTLLVNDLEDRIAIVIGAALPLLTWLATEVLGVSIIPEHLIFQSQLKNVFAIINFLGAFALSAIFLMIFMRTIRNQRLRLFAATKMSSLGEMAGSIAHEINNPLAIISGKAAQLRIRIENGTADKAKISVDILKIEATAERIAKIIRGLRAFSRDSEKDEMSFASATTIVDETMELCREKIKHQGIRIEIQCPDELKILCRPAQISQVVLNLISNAADAVQMLEDKWIAVAVTSTGENTQISVTDSGSGIPLPVVEKMMEPFYTTKEIGKGTGLGLSISKCIIEDHGGRLNYDSSSKNTRFVIVLPGHKIKTTGRATA